MCREATGNACLRVPMVACGPGFSGGKVVEELVSLIDVPPTLLAAGGIKTPSTMRGRPMQGLANGSASNWPEEVFAQISESQVGRCLRTRKWKYSVSAPDKRGWRDMDSDTYIEEYLYDLEADPHERNNLVSEPSLAGVRAELAETLKRRMVEAGEREPTVLPAP